MKKTLLSTLAVAVLIPAAQAKANTYDVYSCWAGSGTYRNPNASSAAWTKDNSAAANRFAIGDDCGVNTSSGSLSIVSFTGYPAANGQHAELNFKAPAGTTLAQADLYRRAWTYGTGSGGASQRNFLTALADGALLASESDGGSDAPYGSRGTGDLTSHGIVASNLLRLNLGSRSATSIAYRVGCGFDAGCPTGWTSGPVQFASGIEMFGAIVSVSDPTLPALAVAQDGLFAASEASGVASVLVSSATDVSGIKKLAVFADGQSTPSGLVDYEQDVNRCVWSKPAPCQDVSDVEIPVDTRLLTDGTHSFVVKAYDAAGNEKASPARLIAVNNASDPPGGTTPGGSDTSGGPASDVTSGIPNGVSTGTGADSSAAGGPQLSVAFDQNHKAAVKAKYGRLLVVRGHLTEATGAPLAGAQVDYTALPTRAGAGRLNLGSVRTDSNGEFALTVGTKLGSRQLRFAYRPQLGGAVAVTRDAQLDVVAPVRLKVGPKRVRNKHAVAFRGTLRGGQIPRKGKLVNLQVIVDGRWHTFATVRSSRTGSFKYRYTFKRTYGRVTYRFRALSRYEAAYPFVAGHSSTVRVRVN